ncbi:hypothetical protein G7Z17_g5467 [Cylindrodendrum hubeiense]|uniref:Uncharacterized protein n=1 Tax=Cylindrodendrum hubeiense TaxID=595255 RepID=A0A9P5H717_9HYPO|nr:hypothetical protein G7Z17_g5467 [Cylindrodendrum hubeiense]
MSNTQNPPTRDGPKSASNEKQQRIQKRFENEQDRHVADRFFSQEALHCVNHTFGNTSSMMYHFGLDIYDSVDCQKASALAINFLDMYNEDDEYLDDSSMNPSSEQLVDHLFSKRELYYVNRDHGNSAIFMEHMEFDINNDADCAEAKAFADVNPEDDEIDEDSDVEDLTDEMTGYLNMGANQNGPRQLAEHFLSQEEIDFVSKTYGDSLSFMIRFGLRFYRERDCLEAKSIAAGLIEKR